MERVLGDLVLAAQAELTEGFGLILVEGNTEALALTGPAPVGLVVALIDTRLRLAAPSPCDWSQTTAPATAAESTPSAQAPVFRLRPRISPSRRLNLSHRGRSPTCMK